MNTHQAYGFDSVNQEGRKVQTAVQLFTNNGIMSVAIRSRTYTNTKAPIYTENMKVIKLNTFAKITNIVNQLLSDRKDESNPTD